jgi:hypothetical protein
MLIIKFVTCFVVTFLKMPQAFVSQTFSKKLVTIIKNWIENMTQNIILIYHGIHKVSW